MFIYGGSMLSKLLLSSTLLITLAGTTSCSKLDDMGKNAKAASDNSGKAATAASDSREEIAHSRMMQRSGGSSQSRREALAALKEMDSFEMKVTEASKFVKAFEYQLWTGQKYDTEEYLLQLYDDAMKEFFRSLVEVNGAQSILDTDTNPFRAFNKSKKDRDLNVFALAVSMHGIHNVQEHVIVPREVKRKTTISIYDIIKMALVKIEKVEKGLMNNADLEEFEHEVYANKDVAMRLINIRANMLLTMNLVKVSNLKGSKIDALLLGSSRLNNRFNSKFPSLNLGEKRQANKYLDGARKVKVFLESIGHEVVLLSKLKTYYSKMRLPKDSSISTMSKNDAQYISEHKALLGNFFKVKGQVLSNL
jgi:hypothetical protein